ncbi:hypothetical protein SCA6_012302 [Theobroma cacao]
MQWGLPVYEPPNIKLTQDRTHERHETPALLPQVSAFSLLSSAKTQRTLLPFPSRNPSQPHKPPPRGTRSIRLQTPLASQSYIRNNHGLTNQL